MFLRAVRLTCWHFVYCNRSWVSSLESFTL